MKGILSTNDIALLENVSDFGNICSIRELVIGSPLRVLDIVVIYNVVSPDKSSLESFRLSLSEKEYPKMMHEILATVLRNERELSENARKVTKRSSLSIRHKR